MTSHKYSSKYRNNASGNTKSFNLNEISNQIIENRENPVILNNLNSTIRTEINRLHNKRLLGMMAGIGFSMLLGGYSFNNYHYAINMLIGPRMDPEQKEQLLYHSLIPALSAISILGITLLYFPSKHEKKQKELNNLSNRITYELQHATRTRYPSGYTGSNSPYNHEGGYALATNTEKNISISPLTE